MFLYIGFYTNLTYIDEFEKRRMASRMAAQAIEKSFRFVVSSVVSPPLHFVKGMSKPLAGSSK